MLRVKLMYGVTPRTRRNARDARFSAIFGRRGITWVGGASLAGIGLFIPVRTFSFSVVRVILLFLLTRVCICMYAPTTGDPLRYHSHFVATVQTSPSAPLRPMEVVGHGRLGTATKKAHLLCGWDPESREVTYISIEWAGFG